MDSARHSRPHHPERAYGVGEEWWSSPVPVSPVGMTSSEITDAHVETESVVCRGITASGKQRAANSSHRHAGTPRCLLDHLGGHTASVAVFLRAAASSCWARRRHGCMCTRTTSPSRRTGCRSSRPPSLVSCSLVATWRCVGSTRCAAEHRPTLRSCGRFGFRCRAAAPRRRDRTRARSSELGDGDLVEAVGKALMSQFSPACAGTKERVTMSARAAK